MPSGNVLHEADALAFHRVGKDQSGLAGDWNVLRLLQSVQDLRHVVAVNLDDFPAKAAITLVQRFDVHYVLDPAVNLQTVAVNDGYQIVEFEVRCLHGGFPDIAFQKKSCASLVSKTGMSGGPGVPRTYGRNISRAP